MVKRTVSVLCFASEVDEYLQAQESGYCTQQIRCGTCIEELDLHFLFALNSLQRLIGIASSVSRWDAGVCHLHAERTLTIAATPSLHTGVLPLDHLELRPGMFATSFVNSRVRRSQSPISY